MLAYKPEEDTLPSEEPEEDALPSEEPAITADEPKPVPSDDAAVSTAEAVAPTQPPVNNFEADDLLDSITPDASAIGDNNSLALAIVPSGTTDYNAAPAKEFDPAGWKLNLHWSLLPTATFPPHAGEAAGWWIGYAYHE